MEGIDNRIIVQRFEKRTQDRQRMSGPVLDSVPNGVFVNVFFSPGRICHPPTQRIFY
jgi:hypothetical protein